MWGMGGIGFGSDLGSDVGEIGFCPGFCSGSGSDVGEIGFCSGLSLDIDPFFPFFPLLGTS